MRLFSLCSSVGVVVLDITIGSVKYYEFLTIGTGSQKKSRRTRQDLKEIF
jgi:hypothetical protein